MGLSIVGEQELEDEQKSLDLLVECSKKFHSVVFNSGAGSGKTYALIECLKSIVRDQRINLKEHNQKIACITYTNVAANHIKKCLGVSDVVDISTIHERIWDIIKNQKVALLEIHIDKLKSEIQNINFKLLENDDYKKYRELDSKLQEDFFTIIFENKKVYYKAYNLRAADFKKAMPSEICSQYGDLLSNVTKFKGLVDKLFKRERYQKCLEKIGRREKDYRAIKYDNTYNRDKLDKMRISHDTLLEYGYSLFDKYPRMKQMLIDKYPYVLIDEYQDTADTVVKIMNLVDMYSSEIKHDFFVAYFGDSVQNIYDSGVGNHLLQLHFELENVSKKYNRRSFAEIISVANNIRNDEIVQESIYTDCDGGSVKFYTGNTEDIDDFIKKCEKKWNVGADNPLHCMFATNQLVAEYSGFLSVYEAFKEAELYQGIGYKQLNSELLSQDVIRLGKIQRMLYKVVKLYIDVRTNKTPLNTILVSEEYRNLSLVDLKNTMNVLQSIQGDTLNEVLIHIFDNYASVDNSVYKLIVERLFDLDEEVSYENVLRNILISLYKSSDDSLETKEVIKNVLNIKLEELINWFHYIQRDENKSICYHTFHSTKGLEYENVAIVLGKDFGIDRGIFEKFFKNYEEKSNEIDVKYEKAKNILYVAVTRAVKNLRVLYVDEPKNIQYGVETIFHTIYPFSEDISCKEF